MFNIENFDIKLNTSFIGRNFIYSEEIDSTNTYLMENENKFSNGTVIFSEFQEDGKGRLKRNWYSEKGQNLTFSILLTKNQIQDINFINLAASLAVSIAIENLYQLKPELKWPNDVLINKKKLSGILLQSSSKGSKLEKIIIGIGINVNQTKFSHDYRIKPTSVKFEYKKEIQRERLLSEVLNVFEELLGKIKNDTKGILDDWRERCKMIGESISIEVGDKMKHGIFYDIDANGLMILKIGKNLEKITNGDITIR